MRGPRKCLTMAVIFFVTYALVDFVFFKNFDLGKVLLATVLYVIFSFLLDKLFNR